jgi:hypothetical protein
VGEWTTRPPLVSRITLIRCHNGIPPNRIGISWSQILAPRDRNIGLPQPDWIFVRALPTPFETSRAMSSTQHIDQLLKPTVPLKINAMCPSACRISGTAFTASLEPLADHAAVIKHAVGQFKRKRVCCRSLKPKSLATAITLLVPCGTISQLHDNGVRQIKE